jgi:hypothetical protein
MMQSPYEIGFGPWAVWFGISLVQLLILGILAWSVVTFMRHRDPESGRPPRTQDIVPAEEMAQSNDDRRAPSSEPMASRVDKGSSSMPWRSGSTAKAPLTKQCATSTPRLRLGQP